MALELLAVNRNQVFYPASAAGAALTLAGGQDIPTAIGGAGNTGKYTIYDASGNAWVRGVLVGTAAPAAGFPRIRFWFAPGDATTLTPGPVYALSVDPLNANTYLIDLPLYTPYFTIEWTQGVGGGTLQGIAWVLPESSGGFSQASPPTPAVISLPASYRVAFDGLAAAGGPGQFLEVRNPAASGRVLRITLYIMVKTSVTAKVIGILQSSLSTGGTATTPTPVTLDQNDVATVGVVKLYTVAPAAGTPVGTNGQVWDVTQGTTDLYGEQPGGNTNLDKPFVLRPGQSFALQSDVAFTAQGVVEFTDAAS